MDTVKKLCGIILVCVGIYYGLAAPLPLIVFGAGQWSFRSDLNRGPDHSDFGPKAQGNFAQNSALFAAEIRKFLGLLAPPPGARRIARGAGLKIAPRRPLPSPICFDIYLIR